MVITICSQVMVLPGAQVPRKALQHGLWNQQNTGMGPAGRFSWVVRNPSKVLEEVRCTTLVAKAVNDFQGQTTKVITNGVQNVIKWRPQNTTGVLETTYVRSHPRNVVNPLSLFSESAVMVGVVTLGSRLLAKPPFLLSQNGFNFLLPSMVSCLRKAVEEGRNWPLSCEWTHPTNDS